MSATKDEKDATLDSDIREKSHDADIQIGDLIHVSATADQEAKVLAKIDRLYASDLLQAYQRTMLTTFVASCRSWASAKCSNIWTK